MLIKELIGETTEYDKKIAVEKSKVKSWLKSVSAYANGIGGTLIFGVSDSDEIIGIDDVASDLEFLSQKIKEKIDPKPDIKMKVITENNKNLIFLEVSSGNETPYYYIGDGGMETYLRIGNETVAANSTELKRLVLRGKNSSYDSLISNYKFEDYSFTKLKERFKQWTGISFEDKMFKSFNLVDDKGTLTNAGALMADASPIYQSRLFCTRWKGLDKAGGVVDALDSAEYSGSLISLLNDGMSFVKRNMKTI